MTTLNKIILSVFLSFLFIGAYAQTTVPQVISSNQTWNAAGSPYIVNQNILIKAGSNVKVMPGTKIRATGNFRIIIEGGFEATGTKDSVIKLDSISFEYLKGSNKYDFKSKTGCQFNYCLFNANGGGGVMTIQNPRSLLISNCKFTNCMWCIYSTVSPTDTNTIRIEKSIFDGSKLTGYVADIVGNNNILEMDECIVNSMTLYLTTWNTITHCYFYNWPYSRGLEINSGLKSVTLKCNTFRKFKSAILEFMAYNSKADIVIVSNTFDSADYHMNYTVMGKFAGKFVCKNNNFLQYNLNSIHVTGGSTPGYADTLVFTKNYWGTTTSSLIAKGIWDINDDIAVAGLVDFANYKSSMISDCIEDESTEAFVGTTAGAKALKNETLNVFPIPASNLVTFQSSNQNLKFWKIYNPEGQIIKSGNFNDGNFSIDVSTLKTGFYMLEANDGGTLSLNTKLIISR